MVETQNISFAIKLSNSKRATYQWPLIMVFKDLWTYWYVWQTRQTFQRIRAPKKITNIAAYPNCMLWK